MQILPDKTVLRKIHHELISVPRAVNEFHRKIKLSAKSTESVCPAIVSSHRLWNVARRQTLLHSSPVSAVNKLYVAVTGNIYISPSPTRNACARLAQLASIGSAVINIRHGGTGDGGNSGPLIYRPADCPAMLQPVWRGVRRPVRETDGPPTELWTSQLKPAAARRSDPPIHRDFMSDIRVARHANFRRK